LKRKIKGHGVKLNPNVELVEEKILCKGKRVVLTERTYRHKGSTFIRDVVKFGQAVAITPLKDNGSAVLVRQFRAPINSWILEVPAGRVEPNENPEEAAQRELAEEIGYKAAKLTKLASICTSPGYSDEVLHIYIAEGLKHVGRKPEPGELIEVEEMMPDQALKTILGEKIADSKTLIALLLTCQRLSKT
jgi:ADP-ribose pyrophosphatase